MYKWNFADVHYKIDHLLWWCVNTYDTLTFDHYQARNKMPFTEDDLSEFSAFVKEVAEEASCIVELPFGFNGLTLECKSCGPCEPMELEELENISQLLFSPDADELFFDNYFEDWSEGFIGYAAPPESLETWEKFFQTLHQKLESKQISDRFSNVITWQITPNSVSFFDLTDDRPPMNWKDKTRLRLAAFLEQCIYCFLDHMENDHYIPGDALFEIGNHLENDHYIPDDALFEFYVLVEEAAVEASCIVVLPFGLSEIKLAYKNCDRAYVIDAQSFYEQLDFCYQTVLNGNPGVLINWLCAVIYECASTEDAIKAWSEFFDILYHKLESHPNPVNEAFLDACWRDKSRWTRFFTHFFSYDDT